MQVPEELKRTRVFVEKQLRKFFQEKKCEVLVEQIADLTLRPAKRIRPFLITLGYRVQGTGNSKEVLTNTMLAVELFHTFALIHDDIMDEDVVRRGGPTIHEKFSPKHFGESMAILAGDIALVWADELMQKTQHKKAMELFQKMKEEVIYGQTLDIMKQNGYEDIDQEKVNELKTAWYSVTRPLQIGAALAGASEITLSALAEYGVPVGKLFQLKDDLMDNEITQNDFEKQVPKFQREAQSAIEKLPSKKTFSDLVRFVVERSF